MIIILELGETLHSIATVVKAYLWLPHQEKNVAFTSYSCFKLFPNVVCYYINDSPWSPLLTFRCYCCLRV